MDEFERFIKSATSIDLHNLCAELNDRENAITLLKHTLERLEELHIRYESYSVLLETLDQIPNVIQILHRNGSDVL